MKRFSFLLLIGLLAFTGCAKNDDKLCGCVPPLPKATAGTWKVTKRFGTIAGVTFPLTDAQKNNELTLNADGTWSSRNIVTGVVVTGTVTKDNFNSIFGLKPRYVFTPKLPMLDDEYIILLDNPPGKMEFGENITDGINTVFTQQ